jgi:hypothetical protein
MSFPPEWVVSDKRSGDQFRIESVKSPFATRETRHSTGRRDNVEKALVDASRRRWRVSPSRNGESGAMHHSERIDIMSRSEDLYSWR